MRRTVHLVCAIALAMASGAACAQFGGFKLPNLPALGGGNSDKGGGIANLLDNASRALKGTTEEGEIELGREFAAVLLGAKPLLANPPLQRYVNALGRWLALQTERPDLPWTFGVLDDPGYNAFATPGGYIFVTRGLVERMRTEAELAGVLAHEIGHVLKKHHLNAFTKNAGVGVVAEIADRKAGGQVGAFAGPIINLFSKGLDQAEEFEADRIGVVIAARAGYDPFGLPAVLQTLQAQSGQDNHFALMFATHPSPSARIAELDKTMGNAFDAFTPQPGKPLKERLKEFK